jgi:ABC-type multidrug transport system ATPase subunit
MSKEERTFEDESSSSTSELTDEEAVLPTSTTKESSDKMEVSKLDYHYAQVTPKSYQFKALFRKNFKLQLRQRCTLCCQIAVPLILLLFVGAMQVLFNQLVKDQAGGLKHPDLKDPEPLDQYWTFFYGSMNGLENEVGRLDPYGGHSGLLGEIPQSQHGLENTTYYTPFIVEYPDRPTLLKELILAKEEFATALASGKETKLVPFPAIAYNFHKFELGATPKLELEILREDQFPYVLAYHSFKASLPSDFLFSGIVAISAAFLKYVANITLDVDQQGFPYKDTALNIDIGSFMAALLYPLVLSWLLPVFIYNIVLEKQEKLREMMKMMGLKMRNYWIVTFIYDVILYVVVLIVTYSVSYAFGFAIFTQGSVVATLFLFILWGNALIALAFFFSSIFNGTRFATIFSYFLVIIQAIVSFVINATVFQRGAAPFFWNLWPPFAFYRAIYLLGGQCGLGVCPGTSDYDWDNEIVHLWIYLFFTTIFFYLMAAYLDAVLPKEFGISKKPWFFLTPILRLFKKSGDVDNENDDEGSSAFLSFNQSKRRKILPTGHVQKSSENERSNGKGKGNGIGNGGDSDDEEGGESEHVSLLIKSVHESTGELNLEEPEDVAREREKVYRNQIDPASPVIIVDLRKEYGSRFGSQKKVAVHNLTLSIRKGECFGLLGPNGAGKTTTISMLTGLFPPSSGTAYIGGFDIRTEIDKVHRVMGVCPQFDTLWMDLTCQETLLFYARLKGVASSDENAHVHESLRQVGLEQFGDRLVKDLSGGMRRRLSVAVSLVGNPRIIFLDEPTTGLDPESRRHLWDVLNQVKANRCIILTTHSMEEADVLCTTIGIMSGGMLRCVGPQQQLKQRFGQGYTLKLNFQTGAEDRVQALLHELAPTAKLVESFRNCATFQVPTKDLVVSELFEVMEERRGEAGITDWGINQTSLEDVFLTIVRNDEGAATTAT